MWLRKRRAHVDTLQIFEISVSAEPDSRELAGSLPDQ